MISLLHVILSYLLVQVTCAGTFEQVEKAVSEYYDTGIKPAYIENAIEELFKTSNNMKDDNITCLVCRMVAEEVIKARRSGLSKELLGDISKDLCTLLLADVGFITCTGYIDITIDSLLYIIDNRDITAERICAIRFQTNQCEDPEYIPWSIDLPPGNSVLLPKRISKQVNRIVHVTDVHYDADYQANSNAECDALICCESSSGMAKTPDNEAGYWGDYRKCDMPWYSVEDLLQHITKQHSKIDWIYFTGDIISHDVWNTTKERNKQHITKVLQKLQDTFGSIPIYPILGNHESHPTDFYTSEGVTDQNLSIKWLFDYIAEEWSRWLPTSTLQTIRKGGYYTVVLKPGFRIIALNSNVCFTYNIWLLYDDIDPYEQLQWLSDTLLEAEKNREAVHILSHVPPGELECFQQWTHEYRRIIERFHNIITGQFNGHTHLDELKVFFNSTNEEEVINVAFNGGSFTAFVGLNPNYRLYVVEAEQNRVLDYEQWTYNLSEANQNPEKNPDWYKLYSFKETYGFEPSDLPKFKELTQSMAKTPALIDQYRRLQVRNSAFALNTLCDDECLHDILCTIITVEYNDLIACQKQKIKKIAKKDEL